MNPVSNQTHLSATNLDGRILSIDVKSGANFSRKRASYAEHPIARRVYSSWPAVGRYPFCPSANVNCSLSTDKIYGPTDYKETLFTQGFPLSFRSQPASKRSRFNLDGNYRHLQKLLIIVIMCLRKVNSHISWTVGWRACKNRCRLRQLFKI